MEDAMRVPISLVDLRTKRGFNRIVKKFQSNWPGSSPITQYNAHQILSEGFGYSDFHALQKSATSDTSVIDPPSPDRVRDNLYTAIHVFCRSKRIVGIDATGVSRLVNILPLQELLAFQAPDHVIAKAITLPSTPTLPPHPDLSEVIQGTIHNINSRVSETLEHEASARPGHFISSAEFQRAWEGTLREGSLRDQCLFMLAASGLRCHELRLCTGLAPSRALDGFELQVTADKTRNQPTRMFIHPGVAAHLEAYMAKEKISPGDFLFPSSRDRSVAMSQHQVNRVLARYFGEPKVSPPLRGVAAIRRSAALLARKSGS
ncbi:hypothetical protein ALP03_00045 [Pseudomonas amygdali pv. tabaci]|uniref:Uncharacterized protein n=1 Tax=Pseudomonas amygdali pv. tabaci TaxID=322 RepID=A0A3M6HY62_PSEAJ|nr:hypothetical protein ALP03_00045 [Pseudomonas amygdali pv. tabaci]